MGDTAGWQWRRRRRRPVGDRGHGAGGVRRARGPSGHDTVAERHHRCTARDDRRVPPAGQARSVVAPRRHQLVPGTGRPALRGR